MSIRILLVDDHEVVRRGLRAFLSELDDFTILDDVASAKQAISIVEEHVPDVVLMDLVMAEMDGVEATKRIKDISPQTRVVVLTSYHSDDHIFPALQAGATSYMLKDSSMTELADAIRLAARGEAVLHPRIASRVIQEMQSDNTADNNPSFELTGREMEILRLIADGKSNQKIASELVISPNTVKGHVSNILSKLQVKDRTQAAVFAWRNGIVGDNDDT